MASYFSSRREKRLWLWAVMVVVVTWAGLGLERRLLHWIGNDVGAVLFLLAMLMVLGAALSQGLRVRFGGWELSLLLGVVTVYVLVLVRITTPTERSHLIEYGVVAIFILEALQERRRQGRRVPVPGLLAIVATTLIGVCDEGVQWFLPGRVFDPVDMLFNFMAAGMAVGTASMADFLHRLRERVQK